jgi:hypothetical protein
MALDTQRIDFSCAALRSIGYLWEVCVQLIVIYLFLNG